MFSCIIIILLCQNVRTQFGSLSYHSFRYFQKGHILTFLKFGNKCSTGRHPITLKHLSRIGFWNCEVIGVDNLPRLTKKSVRRQRMRHFQILSVENGVDETRVAKIYVETI
jgi:hypothetical protein